MGWKGEKDLPGEGLPRNGLPSIFKREGVGRVKCKKGGAWWEIFSKSTTQRKTKKEDERRERSRKNGARFF